MCYSHVLLSMKSPILHTTHPVLSVLNCIVLSTLPPSTGVIKIKILSYCYIIVPAQWCSKRVKTRRWRGRNLSAGHSPFGVGTNESRLLRLPAYI